MKTRNILCCLITGLVLFVFSCKTEPKTDKPANSTAPTPAPTVVAPSKPEVYLYNVILDNLLLRDQPNQQGKVVGKFKRGTVVEGLGERSAKKETVTLNGLETIDHYYKVSADLPEKLSGWAFGNGLTCVYSGSRAGSPNTADLSKFSTFLGTLNIKKVESGKSAWDYVKTNFGNAKGATADAAYIILYDFLRKMEFDGNLYKITEKMKFEQKDYEAIYNSAFDMSKSPVFQNMDAAGFRLSTTEGQVFPTVDSRKMQAFFADKATPAMKKYLDQTVIEELKPEQSDAAIVIPLEELADRGVFWEKFVQENPYFPIEHAAYSAKFPQFSLTNGSNNTPVFDYETKKPNENFSKAWAYVLQKYPDSKLSASVKKISDLVASEGGKCTEKVEKYQAEFARTFDDM